MATLTELVENDETSRLVTLSEGLKSLVEDCDFIVPDTSFVINNIFRTSDFNESMSRYAGRHGQINFFSLIELYKDLSIDLRDGNGSDGINLDEIHDGFDQSLFVSDVTLDTLTSLLLNGKIAVPSQANDELFIGYDICLKNARIFRDIFRKMVANGYTFRMVAENRSEAYYFAEDRKAFFKKQYSNYIKSLIKNTMICLGKLDMFIGLIKARNCIIEDSGIFKDRDERIIDGAMELNCRVGIASCDSYFYEKIEKVSRLRKISGLKVPNVSFMFAKQNFRGYDIKIYK